MTVTGTFSLTFTGDYSSAWLYNELGQLIPIPQQAWDKTSAHGTVGNYDLTGAFNGGSYSNPTADVLIGNLSSGGIPALYAYENYLARQLPVLWMPQFDTQISAVTSTLRGVYPPRLTWQHLPRELVLREVTHRFFADRGCWAGTASTMSRPGSHPAPANTMRRQHMH